MTTVELLQKAKDGFTNLKVSDKYKERALDFLETWLTDEDYKDYLPQLKHLINEGYWDYLLDSFYQIIPFGTGGRRGEVGVGPNRINPWTIKASAQGHSQYLVNHHGDNAKNRGVVIAFDVREFFGNQYFSEELPNPVKNLTCKDLAYDCAKVYTANGLKVFIFDDIRSTPELSFAIRELHAVGGVMISASHNPPEHNGKKVFDETGGQLIPPHDQELVREVTEKMTSILELDIEEAKNKGLIVTIGSEIDQKYFEAVSQIALSSERDIKVVYTPLQGTGLTNVFANLEKLGFKPLKDPKTSFPSGKFENITFNIPNPEVEQSFETSLEYAKNENADLLLSSDPDSDRFGAMVNHHGDWKFLNGNEIGAILSEYVVSKRPDKKGKGVIIKTGVTTNLIGEICRKNDIEIIGDLLVGYKFVGDVMNKLEGEGRIDDVIFSCEESHGYLVGSYARDKDGAAPAVLFSELGAKLKKEGKTIIDYLADIYAKYGYFRNYLTEIRLPGAEGRSQIDSIQEYFRKNDPSYFEHFEVQEKVDFQNHKPIVSDTDMVAKDVIEFKIKPVPGTISIKITLRPSGTEPKIKMYYEIGSEPFGDPAKFDEIKANIEKIREDLEKAFMKACYKVIGVDFPDRGFLLFWQLPLQAKMKYFEVEKDIADLKNEPDIEQRKQKLETLLKFLGSNPVEKIDKAFKAEYNLSVKEYLGI